jgi:hypothetical protein
MPRAHGVSRPELNLPIAGSAGVMIRTYLEELADALIGSSAVRTAVVTEIGDGLLESADAYLARGLEPAEAARAAIAEFGQPRAVTAEFNREIGAGQARRTALALMTSGPLVGLAWIAGAVLASLPPARYQLSGPWQGLPIVGLALIVAGPSMVVAVVSTGRLGLRLTLPASLPLRAAGIAGVAALAADATLLAMLGLYALMTSVSMPLLLMAPSVAASLTRLGLAARASRACLLSSVALTRRPG